MLGHAGRSTLGEKRSWQRDTICYKALKAGGSTSKHEELRGFDPWTGMIPHAASGDQLAWVGERRGETRTAP